MHKLLLSVVAAAPLVFVAATPSPARASWLSEALHAYLNWNGGYNYYPPHYGGYGYDPPYYDYFAPGYSYYGGTYYTPYYSYWYAPRYDYRPWRGDAHRWNEWREWREHPWHEWHDHHGFGGREWHGRHHR